MRRGGCRFIGVLAGVLAAVLVLLARAPIVAAITQAEQTFLSLYFTPEELQVVTATRSLQSIARVAENITVVTATDIELMNAHTLADVLYHVDGVVVEFGGAFGSVTGTVIQGSKIHHVTMLLDGVPLNNITDWVAEAGFITVANIERVEIVKGPASATWGSALGGVVNIITKAPGAQPFQGNASASYGTKDSVDYRVAVSGRAGGLGYYLGGNGLKTDGLTDGFDVDTKYADAKLTYDFSSRTNLALSFSYGDGSRGDGNDRAADLAWDRENRLAVSRLALRTAIGATGQVSLSAWKVNANDSYNMRTLSSGELQSQYNYDWDHTGIDSTCSVNVGPHSLVFGADYQKESVFGKELGVDAALDQWSVFANGTLVFGALSVIPGIRYDDVSTTGSFVSPSLGATWALSGDLLLRATVARGFTMPRPTETFSGTNEFTNFVGNPDLEPETVWSYQAGFEANLLDALWLKAMAFRHDLDNTMQEVSLGDLWTVENGGRQRRQGVELGLKTTPYHHLTLAAGATFMEGEDVDTGETLDEIPTQLYNVSLTYDDGSWRGLLTGNHRHEEYLPDDLFHSDLSGFIVDFNLARKFALGSRASLEAFFSVHNLLDETQAWSSVYYPNVGRWAEGGIRVAF